MVVWITSFGRSGNTFFRVVMHHLYGVNTYAAFNATEVLVTAGADQLVGHKELPPALKAAMAAGRPEQIRLALDELEASKELFVFKTHAWATELFETNYRAVLIVRDGRDALASYANYLVDIRFDSAAYKQRVRQMSQSRSGLFDRRAWIHLAKIATITSAKKVGLRHWLVSRRIDQLLRERSDSHLDWSTMNRSWLECEPKPVVVYFDDLVGDPIGTVTRAVDALDIGLVPRAEAAVPSFAKLKARYPNFFRKGTSGDWKEHLSPAQEALFWAKHEAVMNALNFCRIKG
ncbi:MAG: sulfotransferase domain-containing protein [Pyrinomonadaceae bacterium]|nr:sulfotransferase domain-containing protein [Pyrinomonadaceae bacterium]